MKIKDIISYLSRGNEEAELIIRSSSGIVYNIIEDKIAEESLGGKIEESDTFTIRIK